MLTAICVVVDIRFGGFAGTGLDGTNSSDSSMDIEDIEATDIALYVQMRQEKWSDLRVAFHRPAEPRPSILRPSLRLIAGQVGEAGAI